MLDVTKVTNNTTPVVEEFIHPSKWDKQHRTREMRLVDKDTQGGVMCGKEVWVLKSGKPGIRSRHST